MKSNTLSCHLPLVLQSIFPRLFLTKTLCAFPYPHSRSNSMCSSILRYYYYYYYCYYYYWSRGSSNSIVSTLRAGQAGFDSGQGQVFSLFATASRPALRPIRPHIQCVTGALTPEVKRPVHEDDYSPPSQPTLRTNGAIPPRHTSSWRGT
jgi:hypothetical protein